MCVSGLLYHNVRLLVFNYEKFEKNIKKRIDSGRILWYSVFEAFAGSVFGEGVLFAVMRSEAGVRMNAV